MSDRVWVVSSGSYSDYRVYCAAPSKKAATEIAALDADQERGGFMVGVQRGGGPFPGGDSRG